MGTKKRLTVQGFKSPVNILPYEYKMVQKKNPTVQKSICPVHILPYALYLAPSHADH